MEELLFATHNANKAREIAAMLGDRYRLRTLTDVGITEEIPEGEDTIRGNALVKARYLHEKTGMACFADDTGLIVDSLGGAPGVHTARYAGEECDPKKNIAKLLGALSGESDRRARFVTVIAHIAADGTETIMEGVCEGEIATEEHGAEGFGYDPVFIPTGQGGKTFAEMPLETKNKISHRAKATKALLEHLRK